MESGSNPHTLIPVSKAVIQDEEMAVGRCLQVQCRVTFFASEALPRLSESRFDSALI